MKFLWPKILFEGKQLYEWKSVKNVFPNSISRFLLPDCGLLQMCHFLSIILPISGQRNIFYQAMTYFIARIHLELI